MACVHVFGLTKTRVDDGTSTDNACDVISTIISEFGGNVSYRAVKDLITGAKPENAKLRIEIAALMEITKRRREERPDLARLWDGLTPDRMTELDKQFRHD